MNTAAKGRRPAPPPLEHEGYEWVGVVAGPEWQARGYGRACRAGAGRAGPGCGQPAVACLNRGISTRTWGRRNSWWGYCAEHMYGRWIEDGQVMEWQLWQMVWYR